MSSFCDGHIKNIRCFRDNIKLKRANKITRKKLESLRRQCMPATFKVPVYKCKGCHGLGTQLSEGEAQSGQVQQGGGHMIDLKIFNRFLERRGGNQGNRNKHHCLALFSPFAQPQSFLSAPATHQAFSWYRAFVLAVLFRVLFSSTFVPHQIWPPQRSLHWVPNQK